MQYTPLDGIFFNRYFHILLKTKRLSAMKSPKSERTIEYGDKKSAEVLKQNGI